VIVLRTLLTLVQMHINVASYCHFVSSMTVASI
jgi:hypothetical protein